MKYLYEDNVAVSIIPTFQGELAILEGIRQEKFIPVQDNLSL